MLIMKGYRVEAFHSISFHFQLKYYTVAYYHYIIDDISLYISMVTAR